jgi:hypothetical protein
MDYEIKKWRQNCLVVEYRMDEKSSNEYDLDF